jgi:ketosteroid isomerase-like protein
VPGENLEIVKRIFDGWGVGDFSVGADDLDPNVMFVVRSPFPEPAMVVGSDAISEYMLGFLKQFAPGAAFRAERFRVNGDTVLADVVQHSIGRISGVEGEQSLYMLFTFRGDKIIRMESILEEADALAAAGMAAGDG